MNIFKFHTRQREKKKKNSQGKVRHEIHHKERILLNCQPRKINWTKLKQQHETISFLMFSVYVFMSATYSKTIQVNDDIWTDWLQQAPVLVAQAIVIGQSSITSSSLSEC